MKQSTFSAFVANSIKNLLQGYTKGIRFVAILTLLFTIGVGQVWAGYQEGQWGFWQTGGVILTWSANGTTKTTTIDYNKIASGGSLGEVTTSLNLTKTQVKFWRNEHYGNVCSSIVSWELYKGSTLVTSGSYSPSTWGTWSGSNNSMTYSTSQDFFAKTTGPGTYTIRMWAELKGAGSNDYYDDAGYKGCETSCWYNKNNNTYYEVTFTIPSKKLTVAGAANDNTVSGTVTGITKGKAYTITATPTTGYSFSKWTASSGASSITIANANAASTTVTFKDYANDATVTASFTLATYTVKWVVDGQEQATETVTHGSKPTQAPAMDPNDPICGDKFVGWTSAPIEGQLNDASTLTIYATDNLPAITGETTFYAVFADYEE